MIQYKLIKEYPGHNLGETHCSDKSTKWYGTNFYDAYPDFWQKVEEVDYEIIDFDLRRQSLFGRRPPLIILSVKRLSDGEVFKIGDLIDFGDFGNKGFQPIDKIEIDCFDKTRITAWNSAYGLGLEKWKKIPAKTPLFTTEDGVNIFEGDDFFYVNSNFYDVSSIKADETINHHVKQADKYKTFFYKEKSEEYIWLNKPCLSAQDLIDVFNKDQQIGCLQLIYESILLANSKL